MLGPGAWLGWFYTLSDAWLSSPYNSYYCEFDDCCLLVTQVLSPRRSSPPTASLSLKSANISLNQYVYLPDLRRLKECIAHMGPLWWPIRPSPICHVNWVKFLSSLPPTSTLVSPQDSILVSIERRSALKNHLSASENPQVVMLGGRS